MLHTQVLKKFCFRICGQFHLYFYWLNFNTLIKYSRKIKYNSVEGCFADLITKKKLKKFFDKIK